MQIERLLGFIKPLQAQRARARGGDEKGVELKRLVQTLHALNDVTSLFEQGKSEIAPGNGHAGIDLRGFAEMWLCSGKTIHHGCKLAEKFVGDSIRRLDLCKLAEGFQGLMGQSQRPLTACEVLPHFSHVWGFLESANEVRFRFGMSAEICQRHAEKHPTLD